MTKKWGAPRPPPTLIVFPKSPDQNSEIAILLNVVEKPYNYVFGDDLLPHIAHGRGYKVANFDQCLHNGYLEVYRRFRGNFWVWGQGLKRGEYVRGAFLGGIYHGRRNFP